MLKLWTNGSGATVSFQGALGSTGAEAKTGYSTVEYYYAVHNLGTVQGTY